MKRSFRDRDKAIAVFDSGVGGLTVYHALRRALPGERIVYFGDTARLPYGSKSKEAVTRFSLQVASYLCRRDVKLFVVACNSASALALPELKSALKIPVVGVVEPAVRAAAASALRRAIGVIGTEATIASGVYQSALKRLIPDVRVLASACPLFVPLVEEGWWRHAVTERVAAEYLKSMRRARLDSLILGCTHYPLIKPVLQRLMGSHVRLIDSGDQVAQEVRDLLEAMGLRRPGGKGSQEFIVSDGPERFKRLARRFLGGRVERVRVVRFE